LSNNLEIRDEEGRPLGWRIVSDGKRTKMELFPILDEKEERKQRLGKIRAKKKRQQKERAKKRRDRKK
jgi:hypothetical protein